MFNESTRQMAWKYCRWNVNVATNGRQLRRYFNDGSVNEALSEHTHTPFFIAYFVYIDEALLLARQNVSNYRHQFLFETYPFYCIFVFFFSRLSGCFCRLFSADANSVAIGMLNWNDCFSHTRNNILCEMLISINIMYWTLIRQLLRWKIDGKY